MNFKIHFYILAFAFIFISCRKDKTTPPIQIITPQKTVELPDELIEISGLIFSNSESVYAHNDSGQEPHIYEVSLKEKKINKSIKIYNVPNLDWEDIAQDEQYIYVADSGNNSGQRTNLKILKISKVEVENQDSVAAEIIEFSYPDQSDFSPSNSHNFDCEAILSFGNQLFLFSKNRGDFQTKWYALPKIAGTYEAELKRTFDVEGLITGATISLDKNVITLLGYENMDSTFEPFIWLFYDFDGESIFKGKNKRLDFSFTGQMEAVCFGENKNLFFSAESESGNEEQFIYQLNVGCFL